MRYIYMPPDMPVITDTQFWGPLAKTILEEIFPAWQAARTGIEKKWAECDNGYLCKRILPQLEGFDYIDKSPFGTPTIHNGVNNYCIRLGIGIMDEKEQWLSMLGRKGEDPAVTNAVKQEQAWMHRCAETRRHFTRGLKQMVVRGINHWKLGWETEIVYETVGTKQGRKALTKILTAQGQDPELVKYIKKVRQPRVKFNGPVFSVVDAFNVFFDPEADIVQDRKKSYIIRSYMRPHLLKQAEDEDGEKVYQNLDLLEPTKAHEATHKETDNARRLRSAYVMGLNADSAASVSAKVIPVYTYYAPYLEYDGYEFYDTYFYVAKGADNSAILIRIEENPSINGHDMLVSDTFIDWFNDVAYGIGAVQTVLPQWHRQNFFDAVMTNAVAAAQFPAMLYASGSIKDDEIRLGPAQIMELTQSMAGMDVLKPAYDTTKGVQIGFQEYEHLKQDINGVFEVSGAYGAPEKGNRETATSVNFRASNQSLGINESREKFGSALQKMCQWAYDTRQAVAVPIKNDAGEEVIPFNKVENNKPVPDEILFDDWKRPRTVEITGYHGAFNQQQKIDNKSNFLKALGQMGQYLPNIPTASQDLVRSLSEDLEIEMTPESWMTPEQIAANNPAVMKMALQSLMQNPQMAQEILMQMGAGEDPNGPPGPQQNPQGGGPPNSGGPGQQ